MPTIVRAGKFYIVIFTNDHAPAHVHVQFDDCEVRVVISEELVEATFIGGKPKKQDVRNALDVVKEHLATLLAKWKEIHG